MPPGSRRCGDNKSEAMGNRSGRKRRFKRQRKVCLRSPKTVGRPASRFAARVLAAANLLYGLSFGRSAFARERLFDACRSLVIRRFEIIKKAVRTGFKELRQPGKSGQLDGEITAFNVANGLPMHADQLRQTLLCQVGLKPGIANMSANQSEHLLICHTSSWNGYAPLLTPRIHSVKTCGISGSQPDIGAVKQGQTLRWQRRSGEMYNTGKLLLAELYRFQMSQFLLPRAAGVAAQPIKTEKRNGIRP